MTDSKIRCLIIDDSRLARAELRHQLKDFPKIQIVAESQDGFEFIAPVESFPPNSIGFYDMMGNVWEFTSDLFNINYYKELDFELDNFKYQNYYANIEYIMSYTYLDIRDFSNSSKHLKRLHNLMLLENKIFKTTENKNNSRQINHEGRKI